MESKRSGHTWDPAEIEAHDKLIRRTRIVRRVGRSTYYVNDARILDADPINVAPRDWKLSAGRSPKAIARDDARCVAYEPIVSADAIEYLEQRHCCGILFDDEPMGIGGAFPFGWVWVRLADGIQSWASMQGNRRDVAKTHRALLGPNVWQDGCKFHSATAAAVPYGAADSIILPRDWIDTIANSLGAYRAWKGGDDTDGKSLRDPANRPLA